MMTRALSRFCVVSALYLAALVVSQTECEYESFVGDNIEWNELATKDPPDLAPFSGTTFGPIFKLNEDTEEIRIYGVSFLHANIGEVSATVEFAIWNVDEGTKLFSANETTAVDGELFMRADFDFEDFDSGYFFMSKRTVEGSTFAVTVSVPQENDDSLRVYPYRNGFNLSRSEVTHIGSVFGAAGAESVPAPGPQILRGVDFCYTVPSPARDPESCHDSFSIGSLGAQISDSGHQAWSGQPANSSDWQTVYGSTAYSVDFGNVLRATWEIYIDELVPFGDGNATEMIIGVSTSENTSAPLHLASDRAFGINQNGDLLSFDNDTLTAYGVPFKAGDVVTVQIEFASSPLGVRFFVNNVYQGIAVPADEYVGNDGDVFRLVVSFLQARVTIVGPTCEFEGPLPVAPANSCPDPDGFSVAGRDMTLAIAADGAAMTRVWSSDNASDWNTAYGEKEFTSGFVRWTLRIDRLNDDLGARGTAPMVVGVSSNSDGINDLFPTIGEHGGFGWASLCPRTSCVSQTVGGRPLYYQTYGTNSLREGDVVDIDFDIDSRRLRFAVNDNSQGIAYGPLRIPAAGTENDPIRWRLAVSSIDGDVTLLDTRVFGTTDCNVPTMPPTPAPSPSPTTGEDPCDAEAGVVGPCLSLQTRWTYSASSDECVEFSWGGCDAAANNFESDAECRAACPPGRTTESGGPDNETQTSGTEAPPSEGGAISPRPAHATIVTVLLALAIGVSQLYVYQ